MNEEPAVPPSERTAVLARFHNRVHRYKNLLLSRWWVLVLAIGAALGAEFLWIQHSPPAYFSLGRMIVNPKLSLPNNAAGYTEELNNFLGTQSALLQSDGVKNRALLILVAKKPDISPAPVTLAVTVSPKTTIFNLRVVGESGAYSQDYLDAVMEAYVHLKEEMRQRVVDDAKSGMQRQLLELEQELKDAKQDLFNYSSTNPVVFLNEAGNSAATHLGELNRELANLKSELNLLKMLTLDQNLERQEGQQQIPVQQPAPPPANPGQTTDGSTALTDNPQPQDKTLTGPFGSEKDYLLAKQHILLLKAQREELGEFLRPKHPKILALNDEIAEQEKLLDIFQQQSQEQLENRQHSIDLEIQNLEGQIAEWETKSLDISRKMSIYQSMKENITRLQDFYDRLLMSEGTLEEGNETSPESVAILEPASQALPVHAETLKFLSIAGILGLALGLGVLVGIDRLDDRPSSFTELQDLFDEAILGQIPLVPNKGKSAPVPVIQGNDDRHALVEAYRNLRSSIMFLTEPVKDPRTIVLTSAIPSDGKSTTSANLAITMARAGARVLLVDADLRRGVMHKHFLEQSSPGLAEVLDGQVPWTKAVVETSVPNLFLLPRGVIPKNSGELFVRPSKDKLLKDLGGQYDYLLFDTAPVMAADDVSNLAPFVDGVIMVIRARYTSGRVARAALDLLYMRKVKVLGLVFNAVETGASEYYYYKYKDYYAKNPAD